MIAFNVAKLLKSPPGSTRLLEFEELAPELERVVGLIGPVRGRAQLTRTTSGILVRADYEADVELACGRCLDTFVAPMSGDIEEEFLPAFDIVTGRPLPAPDEELRLTPRHELDLTDLLRQDILVRIPLQPLCQELCPGLCSECGALLSQEACDCHPASMESPFQGLARVLEGQRRDGGERGSESQSRRKSS